MYVESFDVQVLNTTIMGVVESNLKKMLFVQPDCGPVVVEKDIIESDRHMRLFPMQKFNGPCFIAVINFYLSQKHLDEKQASGTFVLYVKEDMMEKFLRAFGRSSRDAEDEDILTDLCGETCNILAGNLKNEISNVGYIDLIISAPSKYKNHVPDGVEFDYHLYKKQEIMFSYWGQKCIAVDACMGFLPSKKM